MPELSAMVRSLSQDEFRQRVGPFVLAQKPAPEPAADPALAEDEGPDGGLATVQRNAQDIIAWAMLHMLEPGTHRVATWPVPGKAGVLVVGRLPDCHVVIAHPSVSKRHAVLRWDEAASCGTVEDVGSKNGTFVNGAMQVAGQLRLQDGDTLNFGDVAFDYLLAGTLYTKLQQQPQSFEPQPSGGARRKALGVVPLQSRLKQMHMTTQPGRGVSEAPATEPPATGSPSEPGVVDEDTKPGVP
jgi:predicted component of type VI protein secretion system